MGVSSSYCLHQPNGAQDLLGAADQFLDAQLSEAGAEGEAHELDDVEDRKTTAGIIFFFNTLHLLEEWRLHLMILVAALLEIQPEEFPYGLNSYHTKK